MARDGAIGEEQYLCRVRIFVLFGEPDRLQFGEAVAGAAMGQEAAVVIGPEI
ncbi:hypothetical protein D3C83_150580 [compost metagenome]